jgi:phosphoribosylformylglycinamidine cyclo-ligase
VLPEGLAADIDRATWTPQPIFSLIGSLGGVPAVELEKTFNMGIGMVAVAGQDAVDEALDVLRERGVPAWQCGSVRAARAGESGDAAAKGGSGGVARVVGAHPEGR